MLTAVYDGLKIAGLACCVPNNTRHPDEYAEQFGEDKINKFIKMTGVAETHNALNRQTASDLAFVAAEKLLREKNIKADSIGALIFVTETPDYITPSTAFVLQYRLGLSVDSICFDMNLGCSGFVVGLNTLAALMSNCNADRGLLLFGDTMTKKISPEDKSICMLLGDAGGALLLEKEKNTRKIIAACRSNGSKYSLAYIPAGGSRTPNADPTRVAAEDGNKRGPYDFYMDGANIFFFSTSDVASFVKEYLIVQGKTQADYNYLVLHQANEYILKNFAKKVKFDISKVPSSMSRFGNTVGSSIPVTLVDKLGESEGGIQKLLMCGFGVGLSCGIVDAEIDAKDILPMIYSDDFYNEE